MSLIKVMIVDDHKAMRNGLAFLLGELGNIEVVGQASDGREFLDVLPSLKPDVVLMDINMPVIDGIEATRKALELYPELKIIALSMHSDEVYYQNLIDLGAAGFILKDSDHVVVQEAIESVMAGKPYFSQELLLALLKKKHAQKQVYLTEREKNILALLCKGHSSAEIAEILHVSVRTIEKDRSELLLKTDTNNAISLAIFAIKNGLINL